MGIPGSGATAIILGAFLLHGVQPGPQVFVNSTAMVYAIFASLFVAVIGMCLIGFFAIKLLVRVLEFPEAIVSAFVVMFCFIGAFSARNNLGDLYVIAVFGIVGFLFERFDFPVAPMVLGAILGPLAENTFVTTMISFSNDWTVLFTRPVAGVIMAASVLALVYPLYRHFNERRKARA
jgi:putative tricarboxylic transport membrane protein